MARYDEQSGAEEKAFVDKAQSLLRQGEQNLDEQTLGRLRQARIDALEQRDRRASPGWLLPAGGLAATAATVAIVVGLNVFTVNLAEQEVPEAFNDIDLLASSDELEFIEQLDFYAWLDEQDKRGQGG